VTRAASAGVPPRACASTSRAPRRARWPGDSPRSPATRSGRSGRRAPGWRRSRARAPPGSSARRREQGIGQTTIRRVS
jgi:hypothetical protein